MFLTTVWSVKLKKRHYLHLFLLMKHFNVSVLCLLIHQQPMLAEIRKAGNGHGGGSGGSGNASGGADDIEDGVEYYRLRSFSITANGVFNLGDSLKSRRSRSINSVTSTGTSCSSTRDARLLRFVSVYVFGEFFIGCWGLICQDITSSWSGFFFINTVRPDKCWYTWHSWSRFSRNCSVFIGCVDDNLKTFQPIILAQIFFKDFPKCYG